MNSNALILLLLFSGLASACSCAANTGIDDFYKDASTVFSGKAVGVNWNGVGYNVEFEMDAAWKGVEGTRAIVSTGMGGGDCGYRFNLNEDYLVYAHGQTGLSTGICSGTKPLSEAQRDLDWLGPGRKIEKEYKLDENSAILVPFLATAGILAMLAAVVYFSGKRR